MEPKDRIIVALDVDNLLQAQKLVEMLAPRVGCFKVGLELLSWAGVPEVLSFMNGWSASVFFDGKFMDIPNTVAGAARAVTRLGARMFNIHCLGGAAMMRAAKEAAGQSAKEYGLPAPPLVLGVTVLTSLNYDDLVTLGLRSHLSWADSQEGVSEERRRELERLVGHLAGLAKECGLDGVVCSPQEIQAVRQHCGPAFTIVTPGVRPEWAAAQDQKRVMTPAEAIRAGADYLVIGRPITKPPAEIGTPVGAAERIAEEIATARND